MKAQFTDSFKAAAKAANMTPEKFAQIIRELLSPAKCRNTSKVFTADILKAISFAV